MSTEQDIGWERIQGDYSNLRKKSNRLIKDLFDSIVPLATWLLFLKKLEQLHFGDLQFERWRDYEMDPGAHSYNFKLLSLGEEKLKSIGLSEDEIIFLMYEDDLFFDDFEGELKSLLLDRRSGRLQGNKHLALAQKIVADQLAKHLDAWSENRQNERLLPSCDFFESQLSEDVRQFIFGR